MSNTSPTQQRNLKSTVSNPTGYAASPQLPLASDIPPVGLGNPYHTTYYTPHDPTAAFAFSHQSHYPRTLQNPGVAQQQQQPPPPPQPGVVSPVGSRKRRASGELELPGSSGSDASAYGAQQGLAGVDVAGMVPGQPTQLATPLVKKGRTNTPWTPAEEQRLKQLREAGSSWSEIAKTFPNRTEGSVKKHWYKDMHYAEFAEDEAIKDYESQKWKVIGQKVGKPAKACEQFAKEQGWKV